MWTSELLFIAAFSELLKDQKVARVCMVDRELLEEGRSVKAHLARVGVNEPAKESAPDACFLK